MSNTTSFDQMSFRNALGSFPTGVTVVTAKDVDGNLCGVTANSFNSVSLDPPLILWSIAKSSTNYDVFMAAEYWNVHILAADQHGLSNDFAKSGIDKYEALDYYEDANGAPVIAGCVALMQCQIEHRYEGGDHIILVGRVLEYSAIEKAALVFYRGQYAALAK